MAAARVIPDPSDDGRPLGRLAAGSALRLREAARGTAAGGRAELLGRPGTLAAGLRAAPHIPPRLREALALAAEGERPIRTVEKLAGTAGCDRRTLWNQWKQAVGRDAPVRLQDFLHWLLLLRAAAGKGAGRPWAEVADEVGVHPHTLGRLARQLTGHTLRELSAGGAALVRGRFEAEVLPYLLGGPRPPRLRAMD
ncbi:MAG TPA: hypothetical protein VHG91_07200 [Longimicrobium sp.]|nr:hypothetical protein [Longimicrobium sp.]